MPSLKGDVGAALANTGANPLQFGNRPTVFVDTFVRGRRGNAPPLANRCQRFLATGRFLAAVCFLAGVCFMATVGFLAAVGFLATVRFFGVKLSERPITVAF
jgi:hypothetical protein